MSFTIRVTTAGSAGSAAGAATSELPLHGYLESIKIDYTSQPATTDVTITEASGLGRTLLTITSANADRTDYPRYEATGSTGSAIAGTAERAYIDGRITVTVAQGDAVTNGVVVHIQLAP